MVADAASRGVGRAPAASLVVVAAAFALLGVLWGTWAATLANIQDSFSLSNTALGWLLAIGVSVAAGAGTAVTHVARHARPLHLVAATMAAWSVLLLPLGATTSVWPFALVFSAMQIAAGCMDAAMNAAATRHFHDQPGGLVRFHAIFNVGAVLGALGSGLALHAAIGWRWCYPAIGLLGLGSTLWWWFTAREAADPMVDPRVHLSVPSPTAEVGPALREAPRQPLLATLRHDRLIGLLIVFGLSQLVDGGVFTWGVLYLRNELMVGALVGAGAYALGHVVSALSRGLGGPILENLAPLSVVAIGSTTTALSLIVEASTSVVAIAGLALAVAAGGVALSWPLLMADVGQRSSAPTAAVGAFTASGYLGWVAGAPIVGALADHTSLGVGLVALGVISLGVGASCMGVARRRLNGTSR